MQFSFSEEQQLIAETAAAVLQIESTSERVRQTTATASGCDTVLWGRICDELGWPLTAIPEAHGGLGMGFVELAILFEQAGKHLACVPMFSSMALVYGAVSACLGAEQQAPIFSRMAAGELNIAMAFSGQGRNQSSLNIGGSFHQTGSHYALDGDYHYVIDGHTAASLLVVAEDAANAQALRLFLVDANAPGIRCSHTASMDQTRKLARLEIENLRLDECSSLSDCTFTRTELDTALAFAAVCLAAEQLGVAEQTLSMTVAYITERQQFGRPVGGFQAMKHKAADMMSKVEAARSAVYYAACIADEAISGGELAGELLEAASIAKAYACEAAFYNAGTAIQMHGGVGFTWEYDVHLYFKRAKAAQVMLGDSNWHKERIASLLLDTD